MEDKKLHAFVGIAGASFVLLFFWYVSGAFFPNAEEDSLEATPTTITSLDELPPGVPPPPPPPDFDKSQFQIPGVTDGIATPTPES